MKKLLSLCVFTAFLSIAIFADVRVVTPTPSPKPKSSKSIDSNLTIKIQKDAKEAKLIIPKSQLKKLRAELEELDNESDTTASASFSKTQTIVSGMFMSLAFVFGGVWFARSRKIDTKAGKTLIAGAVLFCIGSLATITFGNAGPPPELRQITSKLFDKKVTNGWNWASGKIKLETATDDSTSIQLIVPDVADEKKPTDEE